jgi:hypothetical protein
MIQARLQVPMEEQLHLVVLVLITNGSLQQTEQFGQIFLVRQTQPSIQTPLALLRIIEEPLFVQWEA